MTKERPIPARAFHSQLARENIALASEDDKSAVRVRGNLGNLPITVSYETIIGKANQRRTPVRRLCFNGESEMKSSSFSGFGFKPNLSAVTFDDFFAERQADAGARIFVPRVEALEEHENAFKILRGNANAVISNRKQPLGPLARD